MQQKTDEWYTARLGKVTASRVADVMAKTKSGTSASRKNYLAQLLCERLTGKQDESFTNAAMQRGNELEPIARANYELETGRAVQEVGFIDHPSIAYFGASPDGLVGDDGLIEIKCPNTATHLETLKNRKPDSKYIIQMQVQMACTGRAWCDFVSYDDRLPDNLAYICLRTNRDNDHIAEIEKGVSEFLLELKDTITEFINFPPPSAVF